jgi:chromosome segregation ATPase
MKFASVLAMIAAIAPAGCFGARAADPRFPDWPCVQIKVPEISVAAVWTGPSIDDVRQNWQDDPKVAELVPRLAARRTPLDEAQTRIAELLDANPAERQERARLLFAGLFETLNRERSEVMDGIERFSRKQKGVVEKIRAKATELHRLQDAPDPDQAKIDELANQLDWDTRVFEDEKKTVSYVCEVPQLIERRLFALSRMIQQALD